MNKLLMTLAAAMIVCCSLCSCEKEEEEDEYSEFERTKLVFPLHGGSDSVYFDKDAYIKEIVTSNRNSGEEVFSANDDRNLFGVLPYHGIAAIISDDNPQWLHIKVLPNSTARSWDIVVGMDYEQDEPYYNDSDSDFEEEFDISSKAMVTEYITVHVYQE